MGSKKQKVYQSDSPSHVWYRSFFLGGGGRFGHVSMKGIKKRPATSEPQKSWGSHKSVDQNPRIARIKKPRFFFDILPSFIGDCNEPLKRIPIKNERYNSRECHGPWVLVTVTAQVISSIWNICLNRSFSPPQNLQKTSSILLKKTMGFGEKPIILRHTKKQTHEHMWKPQSSDKTKTARLSQSKRDDLFYRGRVS